jgi:hypothetical protein
VHGGNYNHHPKDRNDSWQGLGLTLSKPSLGLWGPHQKNLIEGP